MLKKDQRGYVLSGMGLLLMIPVILLIPIALSLQDQGSESSNIFTKSDTVYRAVKNIEDDIDKNIGGAIAIMDAKTYNSSGPLLLAGNITNVLNNTKVSNYQNSYNYTLDLLTMTPRYKPQSPTMNNSSGSALTKQGIVFQYGPVYNETGYYYGMENNSYIYNYTANLTVNMTIHAFKLDSGYNTTYERFTSFNFRVNTQTNNLNTAATNINNFFSTLNGILASYC